MITCTLSLFLLFLLNLIKLFYYHFFPKSHDTRYLVYFTMLMFDCENKVRMDDDGGKKEKDVKGEYIKYIV